MGVSQETYESVMNLYNYRCDNCGTNQDIQLHHRKEDSKPNNKKYPLFLHSPFNLVALCGGFANNCHEKQKYRYKIPDRDCDVYEEYLRRLKSE